MFYKEALQKLVNIEKKKVKTMSTVLFVLLEAEDDWSIWIICFHQAIRNITMFSFVMNQFDIWVLERNSVRLLVFNILCWLVFINLTQTRVTWEEGTLLRNCLHQRQVPLACLWAISWLLVGVRGSSTVGSAIPMQLGLGCVKSSREIHREQASKQSFLHGPCFNFFPGLVDWI